MTGFVAHQPIPIASSSVFYWIVMVIAAGAEKVVTPASNRNVIVWPAVIVDGVVKVSDPSVVVEPPVFQVTVAVYVWLVAALASMVTVIE